MDKYKEILQRIDELLPVLKMISEDLSEVSNDLTPFIEEPPDEAKELWFARPRCPECGKVSCHHPHPRLSSPWAIY